MKLEVATVTVTANKGVGTRSQFENEDIQIRGRDIFLLWDAEGLRKLETSKIEQQCYGTTGEDHHKEIFLIITMDIWIA